MIDQLMQNQFSYLDQNQLGATPGIEQYMAKQQVNEGDATKQPPGLMQNKLLASILMGGATGLLGGASPGLGALPMLGYMLMNRDKFGMEEGEDIGP